VDALLIGAALMCGGAALLWVAWRGSQRRLPPSSLVGVRLRSTTGDEQRWYAAHEAAAGPLGLGGAVGAMFGFGVVVTGLDTVGLVLASVALAALVVGAVTGCAVGARAARRVG
jgi:hypothetical protein